MSSVSPTSSFAIDVPKALLARARAGEPAAFEQLYRWFERPVFTLALRLTGQREEAQDILQDTMLKLFDRLGEFRGDSPFWGWLRQIAVNESLMQLRRRGFEMDIERMGPMKDCRKGDEDCGLPAIYQAFRWQGLNLSSVDAGLGRYFGTDQGVLVLSSGPELKGLQSGDVIKSVAGKAVESPRDVMRELRDEKAGSQLKFDVLRDRKPTTVTVTVPKSRPLPFMEPAPAPRASIDEDGNESVEVVVIAPVAAPAAATPAR